MKSAWLANASTTPPTAPSSPSIGYPTDGSPGTAPPTIPGAYAFYQVFTEILGVITAAALTPSHTDLTQLKTALDALYGVALVDGSGIPYGFRIGKVIVQWVTVAFADVPSGTPGATGVATFTLRFPHACLVAIPITEVTAGASSNWNASITGKTQDNAAYQIQEWSNVTNPGSLTVVAIGW